MGTSGNGTLWTEPRFRCFRPSPLQMACTSGATPPECWPDPLAFAGWYLHLNPLDRLKGLVSPSWMKRGSFPAAFVQGSHGRFADRASSLSFELRLILRVDLQTAPNFLFIPEANKPLMSSRVPGHLDIRVLRQHLNSLLQHYSYSSRASSLKHL